MESAEFTNEALSELQGRLVERNEERRYQEQMGFCRKVLEKASRTVIMDRFRWLCADHLHEFDSGKRYGG